MVIIAELTQKRFRLVRTPQVAFFQQQSSFQRMQPLVIKRFGCQLSYFNHTNGGGCKVNQGVRSLKADLCLDLRSNASAALGGV